MKLRKKLKFKKLEEVSLQEIQGEENGESDTVECV